MSGLSSQSLGTVWGRSLHSGLVAQIPHRGRDTFLELDSTHDVDLGQPDWCRCPVRVKVAGFGVSLRGEWGADGDELTVGEQGSGVDEGDLDGARRARTRRCDDSHVEGLACTLSSIDVYSA